MHSLQRIAVLAGNTVREAVRDKLLYNLLMFAALMIASSILLAQLQIAGNARIYRDFGLSAIALFGALIAIFVGINLLYREISQRTVYTMLSKPVRRWEFILGKYFGLVALLAVEIVLMAVFFGLVLYNEGSEFTGGLAWAIALIYVELCLVTAVAMFFSSFTTPYLAAMFTVALWIIGHLLADVRDFGLRSEVESLRRVTEALYWSLPNLDRLDIKADAAAGNHISWERVWKAGSYGALYASALLASAMLLFQRRDFR